MKYYTEIVPFELAKKLKEAGCPQDNTILGRGYTKNGGLIIYYWAEYTAPIYCEVFDWLIGKGLSIEMEQCVDGWSGYVCSVEELRVIVAYSGCPTFQEAANAAIEKACELLNGQRI